MVKLPVAGLVWQSVEFLKSLENEDKVWKNGKKSWVFFKAMTSALEYIFGFGQILIDLAHTFKKKLCSRDFYDFYWSRIW